MMINYNGKVFKVIQNSANGDVAADMCFHYRQTNNIVTCVYEGAAIKKGQLMALVNEDGSLDMRYHHVNANGEIMTGVCYAAPKVLPNGKIRLDEKWRWTSGDGSEGESILEEV